MSIDAINWAWSQVDVSPSEKLILLSYADRASESMEAWPSKTRLSRDTCLSHNTIDKGLKSLIEKGKIIKTGCERNQVPIYRLIGVSKREDNHKNLSTAPPKIGTPPKTHTPPKIGGSTPPKIGGSTPPKIGTQNHKKNPQRNPKGEILTFSSFFSSEDFFKYVKDLIAVTKKNPLEQLTEEVIFYADKSKGKRDQVESVKMAVHLIKSGQWKTPNGFKGITSKSIKEKEEKYEIEKQEQIQKNAAVDSKVVNLLKEIVVKSPQMTMAERLKIYREQISAN
jgi:hypothetical protein